VQCEVSFEAATEEGVVNLAVQGDSSALLIGKHGQTLDAIEYILNRIVVRESGSTARIEVDVRAEGHDSSLHVARAPGALMRTRPECSVQRANRALARSSGAIFSLARAFA